jgi:glycogen debranching enzyme
LNSTGPRTLFALKHGDTFVVNDALGDIVGDDDGMFCDDTRVLSLWQLRVGTESPSLLSSAVSRDNLYFTAHLTNRPLPALGDQAEPSGVVHIERTRFVWQKRLYERMTLTNYGARGVRVPLSLHFGADFADIFEVRGASRERRGRLLDAEPQASSVVLRYVGLDDVLRLSVIAFDPAPARLVPDRADYEVALPERVCATLFVEIGEEHQGPPSNARFRSAAARARRGMRAIRRRGASVQCSGELFGGWLKKSRADLALLTTELSTGPYPYAGIPWFATTFGRDGILTALQMLWLDASLARGVLSFLAHNQAREWSTFADAAPGKVLHETRKGEMAALGEVPFGRYYGGVDGTPLFVALAGAYARRTGDLTFIDELWPALLAAVGWIEGAGDSNGDGLVDYSRGAQSGLTNQGWKDSVDSVFHADGSMAEGPIALVEVQGYAFAAWSAMADLAARRDDHGLARRYEAKADALRREVEARYWMPEHDFYGIAIDGAGELCRVCASNAGHLLYAGLPAPERARQVMARLLSASFDSGWGMRTLAHDSPNFNPMSYHNGSVWPHDTGLCAAGFARYGNKEDIVHYLDEMFRTAAPFSMRLPELHCGFAKTPGSSPIAYPVACLPQAWSAGALYMLLQACLGLTIDAFAREVRIERPLLPREIDWLSIKGLAIAGPTLDLEFRREGERVVVAASRVPDDVRVTIQL